MRQVDRVRKTRSYVGFRGFPRAKLFLLEPMPQNQAPRLTTYLSCEYVGLGGMGDMGHEDVCMHVRWHGSVRGPCSNDPGIRVQ